MNNDLLSNKKILGIVGFNPSFPPALKFVIIALLAVTCSFIAASFLAEGNKTLHKESMQKTLAGIYNEFDPEEIRPLITDLQKLSKFNTYDQTMLAMAYYYAAEVLPDRQKWLYAAKNTVENIYYTAARPSSRLTMLLAGLENDTGNHEKALALIADDNRFTDIAGNNDEYYNLKAYIIATNPKSTKADVAEALRLMQNNVMSNPKNKTSSAYLDTLAQCYFASGQPKLAVAEQKKSLALAKQQLLWTLLEHFKEYSSAAQE